MKTNAFKLIITGFLLMAVLAACGVTTGSGKVVTETRQVSGFASDARTESQQKLLCLLMAQYVQAAVVQSRHRKGPARANKQGTGIPWPQGLDLLRRAGIVQEEQDPFVMGKTLSEFQVWLFSTFSRANSVDIRHLLSKLKKDVAAPVNYMLLQAPRRKRKEAPNGIEASFYRREQIS